MKREKIESNCAPRAIGPYSQAIRAGSFVFTAGQIALTGDGASLTDRPIAGQTRQVLENLKTVLAAAGTSLEQAVKTMVFLLDMNDFAEMNKVYEQYFKEPFPARSTVQVAGLPKGAKVEIEVIAAI